MTAPPSGFDLWFRLVVEHEWFAAGRARGLRFAPDAATARRIAAPWWSVTADATTLRVAGDLDRALAAQDREAMRFFAWATNPTLWIVSPAFVDTPAKLLRFQTSRAVPDDEGRRRLHKGAVASRDDLRSAAADARPDPRTPARRPLFEVIVEVADGLPHGDCVVRLPARQAHWTYHVQGAARFGPLRVVEPDDGIPFADIGPTPLGGRVSAHSFRSTRALRLTERSLRRVQLREQRGGAERVLVRRLPGPGLELAPIAGRRDGALESAIYVYL